MKAFPKKIFQQLINQLDLSYESGVSAELIPVIDEIDSAEVEFIENHFLIKLPREEVNKREIDIERERLEAYYRDNLVIYEEEEEEEEDYDENSWKSINPDCYINKFFNKAMIFLKYSDFNCFCTEHKGNKTIYHFISSMENGKGFYCIFYFY